MSRLDARLERLAAKISALPCKACRSLRKMLYYVERKPGDSAAEQQWEMLGGRCPRCRREPDRVDFVIARGPENISDAA